MVEAGVGMNSGSSASASSKGRAMLLRPDKNEDGVRTCSDEMSSPMYVRGRVFRHQLHFGKECDEFIEVQSLATKTFPECSLYKPDEAFVKPALPGGKLRCKTPLNAMVGKIVVDVEIRQRGV